MKNQGLNEHRFFNPVANEITRLCIVLLFLTLIGGGWALVEIFGSSYITRQNIVEQQPVPFSHKHHVSEEGIDCRYCHTTVGKSAYAGMPPTQTCINCHSQIYMTGNANEQISPVDAKTQDFINALAKDLNANHGSSVVIAGTSQPPIVHAIAHFLNNALGNVGKTVSYTEPVAVNSVNQLESLRGLVADINVGKVEMLAIIGGNPAYNAPSDFNFAESFNKVAWKTHLSLYEDETSRLCNWHVPQAHELESWSDARAFDGTISIIQPLIAPLYNGKSAHEFLTAFTENYAI